MKLNDRKIFTITAFAKINSAKLFQVSQFDNGFDTFDNDDKKVAK